MRIAIIGTHGCGKTTLCSEMYKSIWFDDFRFATEPMREVARLGFSVNEHADDASQLAMVSLHLNNLLQSKLVADRSLLDAYVYAKYLNETTLVVSKETVDFIDMLVNKNIRRYDYLFLCKPEFDLQADGFRSLDKKFQSDIDKLFDEEIKKRGLDVIKLTGDTKQRFTQVLRTLFS